MKKKTWLVLLLMVALTLVCASALAFDKEGTEYGNMRVVNCKQWVSLREKPAQNSDRLAVVPLGAEVTDCVKSTKGFIYCQYEGTYGYILMKYLEIIPEVPPVMFSGEEQRLTINDISKNGEVTLNWVEYNVKVLASHETVEEDGATVEKLRLGCFIDDSPVWGYVVSSPMEGQLEGLKAFMGGKADDPQVIVNDPATGLTMLDLLTGQEIWTLSVEQKSLGDAVAYAVGEDGIMYITGTDGPEPVAVSADGIVLWEAYINDSMIYGPFEIDLLEDSIEVKYESGYIAVLEYNGNLVRVKGL